MALEITFLGTGGSWPSSNRNVLSVGVRIGGAVILFDCGEGTQRQLMRSNLSFMAITHIFISHFHGDHFLGLAGLIQSMSLNDRTEALHIHGPPRSTEFVKNLLSAGYFGLTFPVQVHDEDPGEVARLGRFTVTAVEGSHSVPSYVYVLEEDERPGRFDRSRAESLGIPPGPLYKKLHNGSTVEVDGKKFTSDMVVGPPRPGFKLVYSGDTKTSERILEASMDADVIIYEATMLSDMEEKCHKYGHSTARDSAELARDANARYLFLVHLSPRYKDPEPVLNEARAIFENTVIPDDLEVHKVPYRDAED